MSKQNELFPDDRYDHKDSKCESIKCGVCQAEVVVDKSDEWWFTDVTCDNCEAEITAISPDYVRWSSAADLAASRAEMERQQFSADCNEMFGRGNHPF